MLAPSSIALAQLAAEGFIADAAFVDGSHRFHEVFVDLYFLRKIVRPGGLIVLDDHWAPSVRTAARYYEQNQGWTAIPDAFASGTPRITGTGPAAEAVPRAGHSDCPTRRSSDRGANYRESAQSPLGRQSPQWSTIDAQRPTTKLGHRFCHP